jgi:hypothetical protein
MQLSRACVRRFSSSASAVSAGWDFNREVYASMKGRDFLDMTDFSPLQLRALLDGSHVLKRMYKVDAIWALHGHGRESNTRTRSTG